MGECEAPLQKRGTAFQIDHWTIIIMQRSSDRIGPSHFYSWHHTRNDPCGVRAFQRRRGKRRPGAYAQSDCVLPSTQFPNLTDLREALVTEIATGRSFRRRRPRGCRALRGPAHLDAQRLGFKPDDPPACHRIPHSPSAWFFNASTKSGDNGLALLRPWTAQASLPGSTWTLPAIAALNSGSASGVPPK